MPILICPECGAKNPITAERCQRCDASLVDVAPSPFIDPQAFDQDDLDIFPQEEHDLPDLLNALKQDAEIESTKGDREDRTDTSEEEAESDEAPAAGNKSDWLTRVRRRASQEKDSSGELIQDIEHARRVAGGREDEAAHPDFDTWIQKLRDQARDEAAGKQPPGGVHQEDNNAVAEGDTEWLSRVRKAHGVPSEADGSEDKRLEDREGDSLLQWLVELEEGDETSKSVVDGEAGDGDGLKKKGQRPHPVSVKTVMDDTQEVFTQELHYETPELSISREEQTQADKFTATIVDERASRPVRPREKRSIAWVLRLLISGLIIAGVVFSLFFGAQADPPENLLQPQNDDFLSWMDTLSPDDSLLVVFDYSAGFASEINLVAEPTLRVVAGKGVSIATISSSISGTLLAEQMFDGLEVDLEIDDLGYFPLAAYGAFDLAVSESAFQAEGYEGVLILSDGYEGARVWVEQLSALMPEASLNLLVTAQAGTMLLPYWESGQVTGMVSGISEAVGVDAVLSEEPTVAGYWRAYQTGVLMLIASLVVGTIFAIDRTANDDLRGAA